MFVALSGGTESSAPAIIGGNPQAATPVEPPAPSVPERVLVSVGEPSPEAEAIANLERELGDRDAAIRNLQNRIASLEGTIAALERERTDRLIDEFRKFATAEGIQPDAANILADRIIPKIGEIPTPWELRELAVVALDVFPKIDATQGVFGGDMDDPKDRELSLERQKLFQKWNEAAERILGFERAQMVRWGV